MNPAFKEALAARLLWVDVVVFESMEGCEARTEAAVQAAYDAVHQLASNDVLMYRHYGPRAPLLLQDVPELADQYNLAHEVYTELYHTNYHNGSIGTLSAHWQAPAEPLAVPYSKWLAAVTIRVAELMISPISHAEAMVGQSKHLLVAWSRGDDIDGTAEAVVGNHEFVVAEEEEEAYRKGCQDIADTYASIDADLVEGWREECEELGLLD